MSQKVNVNIRLEKRVKDEAKQIADQMGTNLSTLLNLYLHRFIKTKHIEYLGDDVEYAPLSSQESKQIENLPHFKTFISSTSGK